MGTLYKRAGSLNWMMAVTVDGRQVCKSTHTANKRKADQLLSRWETEVFERRYYLPNSSPPLFEDWAGNFLAKVTHPNTRKLYGSSVSKLKTEFTGARVSEISAERIEDYKETRLSEGVERATINHDLRVLRRMMRLAERKRLISRNPFLEVDFLKQKNQRQPHILTFEEEERILAVAPPFLRVLVVLILETGMRSHREALALMWEAINFSNDSIRVRNRKHELASETSRLRHGARMN